MLRVGKSDGNSQVHCRFVVTPSLLAVLVATITWYKYPLHCWNASVPSHRWKVDISANQDHMCDYVITLLSQLRMITKVSRIWRKFGLSLSIDAVVNFFTYLKEHPNFEPFIFCTLWCSIHMGPQMVCKTHTCDCIIELKSTGYH